MIMINKLIKELESLSLLKHPFYQAWNDGILNKEILADYACQYFHNVDAFPRYLSTIHSRCYDIKIRQVLLGNLVEEESGDENHPELWKRFARSLGVSDSMIESSVPYAKTKELIDGFFNICKSSVAAGIGALFAYERQIPEIAQSKIDGLCKFYNFSSSDAGLKFFYVHIEADEWHSQECAQLIEALDPSSREVAYKGAVKGAKLLWQFLDGICESEVFKRYCSVAC
ncbi:CADD family putative folate metabolism protein [Candidatus Lariskella endosymbiont of Epinotia ramella]|uniref:CADD family putative folate metabolism protein n=1 Tax=Candidatus Lariskella endosymbiont of Epinotia ramella TaxID=3066224 RepID=UPI0039779F4B